MEYNKVLQDIAIDLDQIIHLLEATNNNILSDELKMWIKILKEFRIDCKYIEDQKDIDILKRKIRNIYAGMGSFNDIVLSNNGQILPENKRLNKLSTDLFKKII